jgi:hypothetical protein
MSAQGTTPRMPPQPPPGPGDPGGPPGQPPTVPPRPPTPTGPPGPYNPGPQSWNQLGSAFQNSQPQGATPFWQSQGIQAASEGVNAGNLAQDPQILAQQKAFEQLMLPQLQNQAALAGLGNSSALTNSISLANAQQLAPMMESELGRRERRIERRAGATEQELGRRERSAERQYDATLQRINMLNGMGAQRFGQRQSAIGTAGQAGAVIRGQQQAGYDAERNEYLRQQALAEQAAFGIFGQTAPSAFGSRQTSSGGLFK